MVFPEDVTLLAAWSSETDETASSIAKEHASSSRTGEGISTHAQSKRKSRPQVPSSIPKAMDGNKSEYAAFLSTFSGAEFHDEPEIRWLVTDVPLDLFNGVFQTRCEDDDALFAAIDRILNYFRQRHLPFLWHVGPASLPADYTFLFKTRGIAHVEDEPGMAVYLPHMREDILIPTDLIIHSVTTDELLRHWIAVWGCGAPEEVVRHCYTLYSALHLDAESPLQLFLGTLNGKPVATAALFIGAHVASIEHLVTVPQVRRQGIGAAMTLEVARKARDHGYQVCVLTASPMGINIYHRLGFRECCTFSTYQWSPE